MSTDPPEFAPTSTWAMLELRANLLQRVRQFFDHRGFLEVETPLLSADTVVDRHLDPFQVTLYDDPRAPHEGPAYWLQTSPEFAMKRLLAAHRRSIYQITHAFRAAERGRWHNPEFTIVEWYEIGADYRGGMQLLDELCTALLDRGPAEMVSYRDALQAHVGVDPFKTTIADLEALATSRQIVERGSFATDLDGWFELLLVECVERNLGRGRPTILYDYPPSQAALAQVRSDADPVAERFELYVDGVELANGYHELLDAAALRARAEENNAWRIRDGKMALPTQSRLTQAMQHGLPGCTGVALGFDRLVMLVSGASSIAEVISFPIDRA